MMNATPNSTLALNAAASLAAASLTISGPDAALLRLVLEFDTLTGFRRDSFEAIQDDAVRNSYLDALDGRQGEIKNALWEHKPKTADGLKALARAICNDNPDVLGGTERLDAGQIDAGLVSVLLRALAA
jgi:hypothetical protein